GDLTTAGGELEAANLILNADGAIGTSEDEPLEVNQTAVNDGSLTAHAADGDIFIADNSGALVINKVEPTGSGSVYLAANAGDMLIHEDAATPHVVASESIT